MQLTRPTGDRFADVGQLYRDVAIRCLREINAASKLVSLIRDGRSTDAETRAAVFGESLPAGLRIQ
jgi:hypothetical protein